MSKTGHPHTSHDVTPFKAKGKYGSVEFAIAAQRLAIVAP